MEWWSATYCIGITVKDDEPMFQSLSKKPSAHFVIVLLVAGLLTELCWFLQTQRQLGSGEAAGVAPPRLSASTPVAASGDPATTEVVTTSGVVIGRPVIPRHYSHIRIAMLAYAGNPMGPLEDQLLKESVDLVIPSDRYLEHIHSVAPSTPQLVYVNTSSLYLDLLTDWLTYADRKGYSREAAFFHAAQPKPFRGDSPSSQPVTWFWSVYRGPPSVSPPNTGGRYRGGWLTGAARGKSGTVRFPSAGEALYLGYPDPFREINLNLASGARAGWSMVMEYPSAVDGNARPTSWTKLQTITDATSGLTQSGQITFDPPADWKTASIGDPKRLFYLRFRTTAGGEAPVATTILGRDYVGANGQTAGTIPVFDDKADANHDGYLDDAEYAHRAPGKNARFIYESRMVTENYGQMRYGTNVANPQYREWAVNYCSRDMRRFPHAAGFFMDNSEGKAPVEPKDVREPVASYAVDYGALLNRISKAIAPRWLLANTAGGQLRADPVIRQNPFYFEEFAIRPFSHHYGYFEDLAETMARRAALTSPPPLAVIDSHPQYGSPTDPRMQLATLAYYYLLADPEWTFLMFNGGFEPASSWTRHWCPAAAYDIGQPKEKWCVFASGSDPANPTLAFKVYQRAFTNALVLHKPLSYARAAKAPASTDDETATKHELPGTYRPLRADGALGEPTTTISLRNGEGAILVRSK
jgi:hypothetical protein